MERRSTVTFDRVDVDALLLEGAHCHQVVLPDRPNQPKIPVGAGPRNRGRQQHHAAHAAETFCAPLQRSPFSTVRASRDDSIGTGKMLRKRCIPRLLIALGVCLWVLSVDHTSHVQAFSRQRPLSDPPSPASFDRAAVLRTYCVRCHNQQLRTADLALDTLDLANVGRDAEVVEKVVQKLHMGAMPPPGLPRPDQPTTDAFVSLLETELDRAAELHPNPGRTESLHRLNRAEYQNAIRDLLSLDIDAASLLPADDADIHGFDNMAGLLSVSPALLERYMSAARKVSRLALGIEPAGGRHRYLHRSRFGAARRAGQRRAAVRVAWRYRDSPLLSG